MDTDKEAGNTEEPKVAAPSREDQNSIQNLAGRQSTSSGKTAFARIIYQ